MSPDSGSPPTTKAWTLYAKRNPHVMSGYVPAVFDGAHIEPGERVVVARPEDVAREIAEKLRETNIPDAIPARAFVEVANWLDREYGGERRG